MVSVVACHAGDQGSNPRMVVVVLWFNVLPTAKVIWRGKSLDLGLKSYPV